MSGFAALFIAASIHLVMMNAGESPQGVCKFKVSQRSSPPRVIGPQEVVDRVVPLTQDDSPVEILRADFGEAIFELAGERYYFADGYTVKVKNRSDRLVLGLQLIVHVRSRDGSAGLGESWNGALSPGQIATVRSRMGQAYGDAPGDDVEILFGIESVQFSDCEYWPSRGLSLSR
jgi:hypothetical protein